MSAKPTRASSVLPRARNRSVAPIGRRGRYEIIATLGQGGPMEVLLARLGGDDASGYVVLKELNPKAPGDEETLSLLRAEASDLAHLDHPNIVRLIEALVLDGRTCFVLEHVHGRNAQQILRSCRRRQAQLPPGIALYVMIQVLEGLHFAHTFALEAASPGAPKQRLNEPGVLTTDPGDGPDAPGQGATFFHGDINPRNLLVSFDGGVKIADFGLARSRMSLAATSGDFFRRAISYAAPELIAGEPASARTDLYSCAAVLVELLTSAPIFERPTAAATIAAITRGDRPRVAQILPFEAPRLTDVLESALSLVPEGRPEAARALRDALVAAADEVGGLSDRASVGSLLLELYPERQEALAGYGPDVTLEPGGVLIGDTDVSRLPERDPGAAGATGTTAATAVAGAENGAPGDERVQGAREAAESPRRQGIVLLPPVAPADAGQDRRPDGGGHPGTAPVDGRGQPGTAPVDGAQASSAPHARSATTAARRGGVRQALWVALLVIAAAVAGILGGFVAGRGGP